MPGLVFSSKEIAAIAAADKRRQEFTRRSDAADLAARIEGISGQYPHLPAPVVMGLVEAGADQTAVDAAARLQLKKDAQDDGGPWWKKPARWAGGFVSSAMESSLPAPSAVKRNFRTALTAAAAPLEAITAVGRTAIEAGRVTAHDGFGAGNEYLEEHGSLGDLVGQTRLGAAGQVALDRDLGVKGTVGAFLDATTNLPGKPVDGDPAHYTRAEQTWFPGINSLSEHRQGQNARAVSMTDGHATTFGRAAASAVGLEPGSRAYSIVSGVLIDAPVSIFLDPVGHGGGKLAAANRGRNVFSGATREITVIDKVPVTAQVTPKSGMNISTQAKELLVEVPRKTVVFEDAARMLEADDFRPVADLLARTGDYNTMNRITGKKLPPDLILRLMDEKTPDGIRNTIGKALERDFIDSPIKPSAADFADAGMPASKVAALSSATFRRPKARWAQYAPSDLTMRKSDPQMSVEQFDRYQRFLRKGIAKTGIEIRDPKTGAVTNTLPALTEDAISKNNEVMARALTSEAGNPGQVAIAFNKSLRDLMVAGGVKPEHADEILEIWDGSRGAERHFAIDPVTGEDLFTKTVTIGGRDVELPSGHLSAETFDDEFHLPPPERIVRALSTWRRLTATDGWEEVVAVGDAANYVFKFGALALRPVSFAVRNVAEAQARISVDGLAGIWNSPASLVAWLAGHQQDGKFARLVAKAGVPVRGAGDLVNDDLLKAATTEAEATAFGRSLESGSGPWGDARHIRTPHRPKLQRGQVGWLEGHRRTLAILNSSEEAREVARHGATWQTRDWFWDSGLRQKMLTVPNNGRLATRSGADEFIDEVATRLVNATNGNEDLIQAVATGRIGGKPLVIRDPATGRLVDNKDARDALKAYADHLPDWTVGEEKLRLPTKGAILTRSARAVEPLFEWIFSQSGTKPDNFWNRSTVFRQTLWDNIARTAPLATPEAKAQMVAKAKANNLPKAFVEKLEAVQAKGQLTAEDVNHLASQRAFRDTMELLYDSHDRQNWTQTLRMVQPFAAAFQDQYRVWSKLIARNPLVLHRVEQGWHAGHQQGFFYADPQTGEERFVYPFSRAFAQMATGVPFAMSGSVSKANMITSGLIPGFGPAVTQPGSWLIPDKKAWDPIRDLLLPYGEADDSGGLSAQIASGYGPSWLKKAVASLGVGTPKDQRMLANSVADAQKYLASTGDYDQSDPADLERLRDDAKRKGAQLLFLRALAQANAPSSPSYEVAVKDQDGKLASALLIAADFRKFLREDSDSANYRMFAKYGDAAFYAFTSTSEGTTSATDATHDLIRSHPNLESRYPDVWALFADPDSPFSFDEYNRQLDSGKARKLSPEEIQAKVQNNLGWLMYRQYQDEAGPRPSDDQRAILREVKAAIRKDFPLWDPDSFDAGKRKREVEQVIKAAKDPALRGTDAAAGIREYIEYRDQAQKVALAAGFQSFGQPRDLAGTRGVLREVGAEIIKAHPGFKPLWDRVFSREMIDDEEG